LLASVISEEVRPEEQNSNNDKEWMTQSQLHKLSILDKLTKFKGLLQSLREHPTTWQAWMKYFEPENKIPGKQHLLESSRITFFLGGISLTL